MGQAVLNPPESLKGLIKKLQVKFERKPLYAESQWNLFFPGLHSTSMHIPTCKSHCEPQMVAMAFFDKLLTLQRNCKYKQCFICHALSYSRLRAKLETKNMSGRERVKGIDNQLSLVVHNIMKRAKGDK